MTAVISLETGNKQNFVFPPGGIIFSLAVRRVKSSQLSVSYKDMMLAPVAFPPQSQDTPPKNGMCNVSLPFRKEMLSFSFFHVSFEREPLTLWVSCFVSLEACESHSTQTHVFTCRQAHFLFFFTGGVETCAREVPLSDSFHSVPRLSACCVQKEDFSLFTSSVNLMFFSLDSSAHSDSGYISVHT